MSEAGERLPLETFLARAAPRIDSDLSADAAKLAQIADHLTAHLDDHPELAAQVQKLRATLPEDIAGSEPDARARAAQEAEKITADIKQRWIEADHAPLVEEIDSHLEAIASALTRLRSPGATALREAALRIDQLSRQHAELDGVERFYGPWAIGSMILFLIGVVLFLWPSLFAATPILGSFWTILFCLGALPAVAAHYAWTVKPRTRADAEIDRLNRTHFLPYGGLYFPEGEGPACVVTVSQAAPKDAREQALEERRGHKERARRNW